MPLTHHIGDSPRGRAHNGYILEEGASIKLPTNAAITACWFLAVQLAPFRGLLVFAESCDLHRARISLLERGRING